MEQYIPKSAVVAEINRVLNSYDPNEITSGRYALVSLRDFLNSLEVKEVDLEKEIDRFYGMYRKDGKTFLLEDNEECLDWKVDCNPDFEIGFGKHFFELGLKVAQKGE